jgi:hypothetical protein
MRSNAPGLHEVSKGSDAAFLTPRGLLQSHGQPGSNHCCKQGSDRIETAPSKTHLGTARANAWFSAPVSRNLDLPERLDFGKMGLVV